MQWDGCEWLSTLIYVVRVYNYRGTEGHSLRPKCWDICFPAAGTDLVGCGLLAECALLEEMNYREKGSILFLSMLLLPYQPRCESYPTATAKSCVSYQDELNPFEF